MYNLVSRHTFIFYYIRFLSTKYFFIFALFIISYNGHVTRYSDRDSVYMRARSR